MGESFTYQERRGIKPDTAEECESLPSYHNSEGEVGQNKATEGQRAPLLALAEAGADAKEGARLAGLPLSLVTIC